MTKPNVVKCKCENPNLIVKKEKKCILIMDKDTPWAAHIEGSRADSTNIPQWCVLMEGKGNRSCFQHDYKLLFLLNAIMLQNALMKGDFQQITSFWYYLEKKDDLTTIQCVCAQHCRRVWVRQSRTICVFFREICLWGWYPSFGQLDITEAKALVFVSLSYWFLHSFIIFLPK